MICGQSLNYFERLLIHFTLSSLSNNYHSFSDEEDYKKRDRTKTKSSLKEKSLRLAQLLANPLFISTTKYPTSILPGTKIKATEHESAVSVVKQAVAENKEWKKNRKRKLKN